MKTRAFLGKLDNEEIEKSPYKENVLNSTFRVHLKRLSCEILQIVWKEKCLILFYFHFHLQIPPLPMNYRPGIPSPVTTGVSKVPYAVDENQFSVLKVIEKKPNSNLIDLSAYESLEDKSNVRVSVLEAFDPLLVKTEEIRDNSKGSKDGNFNICNLHFFLWKFNFLKLFSFILFLRFFFIFNYTFWIRFLNNVFWIYFQFFCSWIYFHILI